LAIRQKIEIFSFRRAKPRKNGQGSEENQKKKNGEFIYTALIFLYRK